MYSDYFSKFPSVQFFMVIFSVISNCVTECNVVEQLFESDSSAITICYVIINKNSLDSLAIL